MLIFFFTHFYAHWLYTIDVWIYDIRRYDILSSVPKLYYYDENVKKYNKLIGYLN